METDTNEAEMGEIEHDEGQIFVDDMPEPEPTKPKRVRSSSPMSGRLKTRPFHILKFDPEQKKYLWINDSNSKAPPTLSSIREEYGPGRYEIRDADGNKQRWAIGEDPALSASSEPQADPYAPPRIAHEPPPHFQPQMNPYGYQRAASSPSSDPQLMQTFYRMDAAIQALSTDLRRLQDENRSLTYELQQVPARVAERVSATIRESSDPFDQMDRVFKISQNLANGMGPSEDKGLDMTNVLGALAGAFMGGGGAPGALPQAPGAPSPVAPPAQIQAPQPQAPELPGMTPEIRAELLDHAAKRGLNYEASINLAKSKGWDAAMLLTVARATAKGQESKQVNGVA